MKQKTILWVDDEIELLRSHVIFLTEKGFNVLTVTNGLDALETIDESEVDLVFLDEMMPGMGGLEVLGKIKDKKPSIPVVMITKNEEESVMVDAIGSKIDDYLTKPVNPSQVLLVCKKLLEGKKISTEYVAKDYLQDFNQISLLLMNQPDHQDWIEIYLKLVNWDIELDAHPQIGLRQTLNEQRKECNREFGRYVEKHYKNWVNTKNRVDRPVLTVDIVNDYVFPALKEDNVPVFFFVLDCLRYDQWLVMEKLLTDDFKIDKTFYYGILPTATSYSRNALFAGLYPSEIEQYYPDLWYGEDEDETSMNKYEKDLLLHQLERKRIKLKNLNIYAVKSIKTFVEILFANILN